MNFWLCIRGQEKIELHYHKPAWIVPGLWAGDGPVTLLSRGQAAMDFDVLPLAPADLIEGTIDSSGVMRLSRNGHHG
jgi:hypothetical protein